MSDETSIGKPTNNDAVALIERRLKRERNAREQAERLLTEKTQNLYASLRESQRAQKDLELALWASQESFWRWEAQSDVMEIRSFSLYSGSVSTWSGALIQLSERVHEDDLEGLQFHWSMALHGNRDRVEFSFRLLMEKNYQWVRLRGRVLERGNAGEALLIVGTTKDITQQRKAEQRQIEDSKADIGWGSQIRSYVLDQSRVKDIRTNVEVTNPSAVLDGDLDIFIEASLKLAN